MHIAIAPAKIWFNSFASEFDMEPEKREQIQRALRRLAEAHAATIAVLEQTFELLTEELALDSFVFWTLWRIENSKSLKTDDAPQINDDLFSVTFRGRSCFLGQTLPFRLLAHLVGRPNVFVAYEVLFSEVWNAVRSDAAVRSVVKTLRSKLRQSGMNELAEAIDGSVSGHYRLKLSNGS